MSVAISVSLRTRAPAKGFSATGLRTAAFAAPIMAHVVIGTRLVSVGALSLIAAAGAASSMIGMRSTEGRMEAAVSTS